MELVGARSCESVVRLFAETGLIHKENIKILCENC